MLLKREVVLCVELPKRYLDKLAEHYYLDEFDSKQKATSFAKGIGDSLSLIGKEESRYVVEHSYDALFTDFNKGVALNENQWQESVIDGMGEAHKELQSELKVDRIDKNIAKQRKSQVDLER